MSEKVLGFKETDAEPRGIGIEGFVWEHYTIGKKQLVPVVSLEWLEEWCKENLEDSDCGEVIIPEYLIKAAKSQAGEK